MRCSTMMKRSIWYWLIGDLLGMRWDGGLLFEVEGSMFLTRVLFVLVCPQPCCSFLLGSYHVS